MSADNNEAVNAGGTPAADPAAAAPGSNPAHADPAGSNPTPPQQAEGAGGQPAATGAEGAEGQLGVDPKDLKGLGEGAEEKGDGEKEGSSTLGAPENGYDFSGAKLPEGFSISEAAIGKFSEVAKQLNLSQGAAMKLVEEVGPAIEEAQRAQIQTLGEQWLKQAYADPDMGGAKWKATLGDANRALNQFCPPKVKQILAATGLNRNPDVIRMFRDIGRAVGADPIVTGNAPAQKANPLANFYDNSDMNF